MKRKPKYRHFKARDRGFIEVAGQRHYLPGKYGSRESLRAYHLMLAKLSGERVAANVGGLLEAYLNWAKGNYSAAPGNDNEFGRAKRLAQKYLIPMFGMLPIADFGPLRLKELQAQLVDDGYTRKGVNARVQAVVRIFRWGVSEEIVPVEVLTKLETVKGLSKGKTSARETTARQPIAWEAVEATLPFLSPTVRDMVLIQWFTGCRPQTVCGLTPAQVDRSFEDVWLWQPDRHKNDWRGQVLQIFVGPRCQEIMLPYLLRPADEPCFRSSRGRPHDSRSYRQSVLYALARSAGIPIDNPKPTRGAIEGGGVVYWSPHQLRHARGQAVRDEFGLEAAQATLGHASISAAEIYARRLGELARRVASESG